MKVKTSLITAILLAGLVSSPLASLAAGSDKEATVREESVEISSKIDKALDSVNQKYTELASLKTDVQETEKRIVETEATIVETEKSIAKRTEVMGSRMKDLQVKQNGSLNIVDALLNAENFSDFINRAYAVSVLQGAEKTKVESLANDKEKLETLKTDLVADKDSLSAKQDAVEQDSVVLAQDVSALKEELSSNQALLQKLSNERLIQESKKQTELAKAENAKKEKVQAAKKESTTTSSTTTPVAETTQTEATETSSEPEQPVAKPSTPPTPETNTGGGKVMTMEATGYSYKQPGLSFYTSTGIDLRQNSRVIAVDPSVIPLNSLVEVSGYGFAVAGDIGGAIVGNRIDLHFNSVEECTNWGRRMVTVTVQ